MPVRAGARFFLPPNVHVDTKARGRSYARGRDFSSPALNKIVFTVHIALLRLVCWVHSNSSFLRGIRANIAAFFKLAEASLSQLFPLH